MRDIVVVGASAGGVEALQTLVGGLPPHFPAAIFIVLHTWPGGDSHLAPILSRAGQLPALQPVDGDVIRAGTIYVAPVDWHLLVESGKILIVRGPRENRFRPAINPLFRSAATTYGNRVIGVILTGMLDDGAAGIWAVKRSGGLAVVQSDAAFKQMPEAALNNVKVDFYIPLAEIPPLLNRLVRERVAPEAAPKVPELVRVKNDGAKMVGTDISLDGFGQRSLFSCPECNGALWEIEEGKQLHYRCHVGHGYSGQTLAAAQANVLESSLWSALRALKESAALDLRLAESSRVHGLTSAATAHEQNAQKKLSQAQHLQDFFGRLQPVD